MVQHCIASLDGAGTLVLSPDSGPGLARGGAWQTQIHPAILELQTWQMPKRLLGLEYGAFKIKSQSHIDNIS